MSTDHTNGPTPPNRARRVVGLCLVFLGLLIIARDASLGISYWPQFRAEDRIRFVFWLWAGALLTLLGYWLGTKRRAAAYALVAVVASSALIVYSYERWWS